MIPVAKFCCPVVGFDNGSPSNLLLSAEPSAHCPPDRALLDSQSMDEEYFTDIELLDFE